MKRPVLYLQPYRHEVDFPLTRTAGGSRYETRTGLFAATRFYQDSHRDHYDDTSFRIVLEVK